MPDLAEDCVRFDKLPQVPLAVCRQLSVHRNCWHVQKLMGDLRKSLMHSRWADVQIAAASQRLQEIEDAIELCFADDTSEVGMPPLAMLPCIHGTLAERLL